MQDLLGAALVLAAAMKNDDNNFYLKLLFIFILRDLCGPSLAFNIYHSLNIKFVQVDMLRYR